MIQKVHIKNFKSIVDAELKLSPFTLLIGPNGAGKSNLLKVFELDWRSSQVPQDQRHFNHQDLPTELLFTTQSGVTFPSGLRGVPSKIQELIKPEVFNLRAENAGVAESLVSKPEVHRDGSGMVQVLDSLKTGDREDLFDTIEARLKQYIPNIEKLSFIPGGGSKSLQVREKHIETPIPVSELSTGTKLVLIILTILYQERPPSLVCIEEIDHALHPRLFQKLIELCRELAGKDGRPQIIATTHNPYIVDLFRDYEDSVVIVDKKQGCTTFTTLEERMEQLGYEQTEESLGELWFSGLVGGVPGRDER